MDNIKFKKEFIDPSWIAVPAKPSKEVRLIELLVAENQQLKSQLEAATADYDALCDYAIQLEDNLDFYADFTNFVDIEPIPVPVIKQIYYCDKPGKEKVIVIFDDQSKIIKEMCQGDSFDLNVGVALCIAEKLYGSKSKFHKIVKQFTAKTEAIK